MRPSLAWLGLALAGIACASPAKNLVRQSQPDIGPVDAMLKSKGANASCDDLEYKGFEAESTMWNPVDASNQLSIWFKNWKPKTPKSPTWLYDFVAPWQHGQEYKDCTTTLDCVRPSCPDIQGGDSVNLSGQNGTAWVYLVWLSAVNLNLYLKSISDAATGASAKFSLLQVSITKTFFYNPPDTIFAEKEALNALGTAYGAVFALAGVLVPALGAVGGLISGAFAAGAMTLNAPNPASEDLDHVVSLELFGENWLSAINTQLTTMNNDLLVDSGTYGDINAGGVNIQTLLANGAFVGSQDIPILSANSTAQNLIELFYQVMVGGLVNLTEASRGLADKTIFAKLIS